MRILGKHCQRVDTQEGNLKFQEMYTDDPYKFIFEHELFNISRIFNDTYQYIVFLGYEATPNQIFYIEDDEHLMIYNDIDGAIFNTDSMAFFSLIRDSKRIGTFCTEHSPYSFPLSDIDNVNTEFSLTPEEVLEKIVIFCKNAELENIATINNTLIVREL